MALASTTTVLHTAKGSAPSPLQENHGVIRYKYKYVACLSPYKRFKFVSS
jgi:hypothetical protein